MPMPERTFNLVPFRDKLHYLQTYTSHTSPENIEFYKDLFGNIVLFIPFPLLVFYISRNKSRRRLLIVSVCASFFIEIMQFIFNIGVADIDDILLNTIGASAGLLMLQILPRTKRVYYSRSNSGLGKTIAQVRE